MVEGVSGLLAWPGDGAGQMGAEPGQFKWPMGSVAQLYSGDNADGLRGPEHHFAWCDELAKWRQADAAGTICRWGCGRDRGRGRW